MPKLKSFFHVIDAEATNIVNAPHDEHTLLRRALAHELSEASMRQQGEPAIVKYVDLLLRRLHAECDGGKK